SMSKSCVPVLMLSLASLSYTPPLAAQTHGPTAADYERARRFLAPALTGLVVGGNVAPNWTSDGRFWYRNATLGGTELVVIDPAKRTRVRCESAVTEWAGLPISAEPGRDGAGGRPGGRGAFSAPGQTSSTG